MTSPNESLEPSALAEPSEPIGLLPPPSREAMQGYYQLQQTLLRLTVLFSGIVFVCVWYFYSLHVALNYLIGACTGVVYLRMLAKNVAEIGRQQSRFSSGRLAILIGVLVLSTQWQQLEVLPVFLGFLTYKAALIAYTIWTAALPE